MIYTQHQWPTAAHGAVGFYSAAPCRNISGWVKTTNSLQIKHVAHWLFLLLTLLAASISFADAPPLSKDDGYSLSNAISDAINSDPRLKAARAEHTATQTEITIARAGYYPSVSVQAGVGDIDGETEYQLNVRQMVYDWGRVASQVDNSRAENNLTSEKLRLAQANAAFDTADAFLRYVQTKKAVSIYNDYIVVLNDLLQIAEKRTQGQFSSRVEVDRAQVEKSRALESRARYQGLMASAQQALFEYTGNNPENLSLTAPPRLPVLSIFANTAIVDKSISLAPQVMADKEEVGRARAELKLRKAELWPQLNLEADWVRRQFNEEVDTDVIVALRLRSETDFGLSSFRRPHAARSRLAAREHQVRATRRDLRRSLQQLSALQPALEARIAALGAQSEGSLQIMATYQQQFIAGLRDFDDLLSVNRDHFDARRQKIELYTELLRQQYQVASDFGVLNDMLAQQVHYD